MEMFAVADLTAVVYSAGKVFNGLDAGRMETENFLRHGSLDGIASRADIALLHDLRDCAQLIIDCIGSPINVEFVRAVNLAISRSGSLRPGQFRRSAEAIGVDTGYGRHEPDAVTEAGLQQIIDEVLRGVHVYEAALEMFVALAKAQPFGDGNRRTALLVANAVLLSSGSGKLLTVPVGDADTFHDLLARAYRLDDRAPVKRLLREKGFVDIPVRA